MGGLLYGAVSAADAAELVVRVRRLDGPPLGGLRVRVHKPLGDLERHSRPRPSPGRHAVTDEEGWARFGLSPGTYEVDVPGSAAFGLVAPGDNPHAPPPVVTLGEGESRGVVVELWPGVGIEVGTSLVGWDRAGWRVHFAERGTGVELQSHLSERRPQVFRLLPPGLWEISMEAPSGFLLVALLQDREALAGHAVTLDLSAEPFSTSILFEWHVEARLEGRLAVTGPAPELLVEATLLEPGSWYEAALARGGSRVERIQRRRIIGTDLYELPLPSGRWRVKPMADVAITSEPQAVELLVAEGETHVVDFSVESEVAPEALSVYVTGEGSSGIANAVVEVTQGETLIQTLSTDPTGRVHVLGLEPGDVYRVVAGHAQWLAASEQIRFAPAQRGPSFVAGDLRTGDAVRLVLPRGAVFEIEARGVAGRPLGGVEVTVQRVEEEADLVADGRGDPASALRSPEIRRAKERRVVVTDRRGRARAGGFYAGSYLLEGRLTGSEDALGRILLATRRRTAALELDLDLAASETLRVEATLVPAARFSVVPRCDDGGALPATTDVRVYRAVHSRGNVAVALFDEEPVLELGERVLAARSPLVLGPLDAGAFEVAIRPQGFDRWTWAFETTERERAVPLEVGAADVRQGRELPLGVFVIECEPAIDLRLLPDPPVELDFSHLEVQARLFDAERAAEEGVRSKDASRRELQPPRVRRAPGRIELRRIQTGRTRLRLEIAHPFLLPSGPYPSSGSAQQGGNRPSPPGSQTVQELDLDLQRGGYQKIDLPLPVGGLVIVEGPAGSAVLVEPMAEGRPASWLLSQDTGQVRVGPLGAGRYRFSLCSERSCREPRDGQEVEVEPGQERRLRFESRVP